MKEREKVIFNEDSERKTKEALTVTASSKRGQRLP